MKYAWIEGERDVYPLPGTCPTLGVGRSGYRARRRVGRTKGHRVNNEQLLAVVRALHAEIKGAYGSQRMVKDIRRRGFPASTERIQRLLRENGIWARHKRRYKATTITKNGLPVAPNQVWTADLTYIRTDAGWLYLAIALERLNREVVGSSIKLRTTADVAVDALTIAWVRHKPAPGLIHHSDRGSQYASGLLQEKLVEFGMICPMCHRGNCWGNAPTEGFFNSLRMN